MTTRFTGTIRIPREYKTEKASGDFMRKAFEPKTDRQGEPIRPRGIPLVRWRGRDGFYFVADRLPPGWTEPYWIATRDGFGMIWNDPDEVQRLPAWALAALPLVQGEAVAA